ncbi:MAG: hypothetical protein KME27_03330 [Lyngbya sp. HA4199-MV5]|jgi:hypothetical protein|nr:hypothetical protein [Lyngbya sp. HA4199-MV5]
MRLHHTIGVWKTSEAAIAVKQAASDRNESVTESLIAHTVPIKRVGKATTLLYASAIAHQLAAPPDQAATIAAQLVDTLKQDLANHPALSEQGIAVHATAAGFIHFEVGDRAIAAWLDLLLTNALPQPSLPTAPVSKIERQLMLKTPALFEVQHAHARCCSLLRLAHDEAFIHLELAASPKNWWFVNPSPLLWLTSSHQLYFQHFVDRALLTQLFDAYDQLSAPFQRQTQASVLRSAQTVAHAFQAFHRAHPLWERVQEDSAMTLARLGLLMITQRVLHLLLRDGLKTDPMVEL